MVYGAGSSSPRHHPLDLPFGFHHIPGYLYRRQGHAPDIPILEEETQAKLLHCHGLVDMGHDHRYCHCLLDLHHGWNKAEVGVPHSRRLVADSLVSGSLLGCVSLLGTQEEQSG